MVSASSSISPPATPPPPPTSGAITITPSPTTSDFPARAEIRANREHRAEEMHHHRIELDHFNQHIATKRLALAERSLNLRESLAGKPLNPNLTLTLNPSKKFDSTPYADSSANSADKTHSQDGNALGQGEGIHTQPNDAHPADQDAPEKTQHSELRTQHLQTPSSPSTSSASKPNPFLSLPPETIAKNLQHLHDLAQGKIKPKFIPPEIPCPDPDPLWKWLIDDYVARPGVNTDPSRSAPRHELNETTVQVARPSSGAGSGTVSVPVERNQTTAAPADQKNQNNQEQEIPSTSVSSLPLPSASSALTPAELAARIDRYTIARMREYIAHDQKYTPWPYRQSPPEYTTQLRHCPCGHHCPCPIHESKEFGTFPETFWKIRPLHPVYAECLNARNLPFRFPQEFCA